MMIFLIFYLLRKYDFLLCLYKVIENLALGNNINYNKILCRPLDKAIQEHYGTIKVDINKLSKIL